MSNDAANRNSGSIATTNSTLAAEDALPPSFTDQSKQREPVEAPVSEKVEATPQTLGDGSSTAGKKPLKPLARAMVFASIFAILILWSMDMTIIADIQPAIISSLGDIEKFPWLSVAYFLGMFGTHLFWGKLYGQFSVKYLFMSAAVILEAGSALCGAAPTMDALIVGRAICGVAGIGCYLGGVNLVSHMTTLQERPLYIGFLSVLWGIGTTVGPLIGGAFTDSKATWRWSFYLNLCVGAVVAPVVIFILPNVKPKPQQSVLDGVRQLDFVGAILSAGAACSLVMAISFGGALYLWSSGQIISLFVVTGVLWIAFGLQQYYCIFTAPERRLFPAEFLKEPQMALLGLIMFISQWLGYIPIYFLSLYFQFVHDETALRAGVEILPFILMTVFAIVISGYFIGKVGWYMAWYFCGSAISLIGSALLLGVKIDTTMASIYGFQILAGFGNGLFRQAAFVIAQVKMKGARIGPAVAFIGITFIAGQTLSLAVSNSVFINQSTDRISTLLPGTPRDTIQDAVSGAEGSALFDSLGDNVRETVLEAIVKSINETFIITTVASALVLLLSLGMKRERLFPKARK